MTDRCRHTTKPGDHRCSQCAGVQCKRIVLATLPEDLSPDEWDDLEPRTDTVAEIKRSKASRTGAAKAAARKKARVRARKLLS